MKWIALLGRQDMPTDGIEDYCLFLARALALQGIELEPIRLPWIEMGWVSALRQLKRASAQWRGEWVLLQYAAFSWSRSGFPFGAIATVALLRRSGVRCAVVFHEPGRQTGLHGINRVRGVCQDWVVHTLYRQAEKGIFADPLESIEWLPKGEAKAVFIPIGANIPECPPRVQRANDRDGAARTVAVFCLSDPPNRQREVSEISQAMRSVAANGIRLRLVFLGRGTTEATEEIKRAFRGSSVEVSNLGLCSAEEISRILGESDAMLCVRGRLFPRRGSALAGIACGLPIVAYAGAAEGTPLAEAGVELVPYGDREALGAALTRVLLDQQYWQQLYERNVRVQRKYFSWDPIALAFADMLTENRINP